MWWHLPLGNSTATTFIFPTYRCSSFLQFNLRLVFHPFYVSHQLLHLCNNFPKLNSLLESLKVACFLVRLWFIIWCVNCIFRFNINKDVCMYKNVKELTYSKTAYILFRTLQEMKYKLWKKTSSKLIRLVGPMVSGNFVIFFHVK